MTAPATIDEFQARLVQVSESLPKRLLQCADYIAQNTDRIAVSTVAELAGAAGVQPSAFMRFCQLMGFHGFSDMQRMFRENYVARWPDYATRLENLRAGGANSPTALLAEFVEAGRASLGNLAATIDEKALNAAVDVLARAHAGPVPVGAQDQGRRALAGRLAPDQAGHRLAQGPQGIELARPEIEQRRRDPAVRREQGWTDDSAHGRTIRAHIHLCIHVYIEPDWV